LIIVRVCVYVEWGQKVSAFLDLNNHSHSGTLGSFGWSFKIIGPDPKWFIATACEIEVAAKNYDLFREDSLCAQL